MNFPLLPLWIANGILPTINNDLPSDSQLVCCCVLRAGVCTLFVHTATVHIIIKINRPLKPYTISFLANKLRTEKHGQKMFWSDCYPVSLSESWAMYFTWNLWIKKNRYLVWKLHSLPSVIHSHGILSIGFGSIDWIKKAFCIFDYRSLKQCNHYTETKPSMPIERQRLIV